MRTTPASAEYLACTSRATPGEGAAARADGAAGGAGAWGAGAAGGSGVGVYTVCMPGEPVGVLGRRAGAGVGATWEDREQSLAGGSAEQGVSSGKPLRRLLWGMAEALVVHGCSTSRVSACCRARWQRTVDVVVRREQGRQGEQRHASYRGLTTCTSVWACPICMRRIKAGRAEEIKALVAHHGQDRVEMLTLTVRHSAQDDVRALLDGIRHSVKLFQQGRDWGALQRRHGILGLIRAVEITHGQHGWHPHHHVLIFMDRSLSDEDREVLRGALSARWRGVVTRSGLGEPHEPDDLHGCCLTPVRQSEYLSKLGLEVADIFTKRGRVAGSRTPLQIAHDIMVHRGRVADVVLWRSYCAAMKGVRFLSYTQSIQEMRKVLGLRATDEELVQNEEAEPELVASLDRHDWWTVMVVVVQLLMLAATSGRRERNLPPPARRATYHGERLGALVGAGHSLTLGASGGRCGGTILPPEGGTPNAEGLRCRATVRRFSRRFFRG